MPSGFRACRNTSIAKEVKRVTSAKDPYFHDKRHTSRLTVLPGAAWHWRLCSLLMLALLASFLIPRPDAANAATGGPKPPARPNPTVVVIGDFYSYGSATSAEPALQKSAPPTPQALKQIQAANRGVNVNVLFIPVSAATSTSLFQPASLGTSSARLTLINAVRRASTVIVGVGGGNATLAESLRSVLFGGAVSAKAFSQLMANFDNGSYLRAQIALLDAIAARAAPGMSIVTLGYPTMLGEQLPSGFTWFSPSPWTAVSQQRANMSDQLVSPLNTANEESHDHRRSPASWPALPLREPLGRPARAGIVQPAAGA